MKNILILPFLILTLNVEAQMDTAYLPPFAFLTYDAQEWNIRQSENDRYSSIRLDGKIDKGFEIKIRLNIGDTLITKENLLASLEKRSPYGRELILEKFDEKGDFFLGVFSFSQDECSRDDIPIMFKSMKFRAAFRIIENTNLLTIEIDDDSFLFPEDVQTSKIQSVIDGINVITPQQLDQLLDLPMTAQKAQEVVNVTYNKSYKKYFDFNLSKRKCFDDSYFYDELNGYYELKEIDSLLRYATDSVLCDIVAFQQASDDSTEMADRLRQQVEMGFNYVERTELLKKARNETFSLEEYLDFQLSEAEDGPIRRLSGYVNFQLEYSNNNKYSDVTERLFGQKFLPEYDINDIKFLTLRDHKYVMKIEAARRDTIYETLFFHLQKNKNSYDITRIPLPTELAQKKENSSSRRTNRFALEKNNNLFVPSNEYDIAITPSPDNQILTLYKDQSNSLPAYISIGSSKDIQWIPISSVAFDSSKYILLSRGLISNSEFSSGEQSTMLWDQFSDSLEKERLNNLFYEDFEISLYAVANLQTSHDVYYSYDLGMPVEEAIKFNGSDIAISTKDVKSFVIRNTLIDYIAYLEEGIEDINKDGTDDLYCILICNGKVQAAKAYIIEENTYTIIGTEEVVNLLKDNTGFKNLLLKSQIGNHGTNEITDDSDLYKITTK